MTEAEIDIVLATANRAASIARRIKWLHQAADNFLAYEVPLKDYAGTSKVDGELERDIWRECLILGLRHKASLLANELAAIQLPATAGSEQPPGDSQADADEG